jgi:hypothetical protein
MTTYHLAVYPASCNAGASNLEESNFEAANEDAAIDKAVRIMRGRPEHPYELEGELHRIHDDGDTELIGEVRPW